MSAENKNQDHDNENISKRWKECQKKFSEVGYLGVTAEDHWNIGSSPPILLNRNPGKTLGELYSDEKILEYLDKLIEYRERAQKILKTNPDDKWANGDLEDFNERFPATIRYLESIGRLPDKYKNYE